MKQFLIWIGVFCSIVAAVIGSVYWWWFEAPHQLTTDVVYGQRDGKQLLLDVFTPPDSAADPEAFAPPLADFVVDAQDAQLVEKLPRAGSATATGLDALIIMIGMVLVAFCAALQASWSKATIMSKRSRAMARAACSALLSSARLRKS